MPPLSSTQQQYLDNLKTLDPDSLDPEDLRLLDLLTQSENKIMLDPALDIDGLAPIQDNLRFLFGDDSLMLHQYMQKKIIEMEALTYIRGRSIQKAYIIIDECQNLTRHEIKTILTRVGHGSKIVLTGDIEQIDNVNIDETSNGLTYAIEKLKPYDITGHITFLKGERSKVATLTSKVL